MDEPFFVSVLSSTPIRRTHTNTHNVNTKNTMEICISNQNQYINLTSICVALGIEALFASAFIHIESPARTWTPSKSQMMTESMCKQTPANNVSKLNENNVFSFNKMVIFYVCIVATSIVPSLCHIFLFHLSLSLSFYQPLCPCVRGQTIFASKYVFKYPAHPKFGPTLNAHTHTPPLRRFHSIYSTNEFRVRNVLLMQITGEPKAKKKKAGRWTSHRAQWLQILLILGVHRTDDSFASAQCRKKGETTIVLVTIPYGWICVRAYS